MLDLTEARSLLARAPGVFRALLTDLPEPLLSANEGGDTWSPRDVLAHVTDVETTEWIGRMKIVIGHGESRAFDPLDRERFRVLLKDAGVSDLLEQLTEHREANLRALDALHLTPADLHRRGRHPTIGTVTLGQLLATWAVHDLDHIAQIVRVVAGRFRADVGPWEGMIRVLRQ